MFKQTLYNTFNYPNHSEFIPVIYTNDAMNSAWRKYPMIYIRTANFGYPYDNINFVETFAGGFNFVNPKDDLRMKNRQYNMNVFYIPKLNYVIYIPSRYMTNDNHWRDFEKTAFNTSECYTPVMVSVDTNNKVKLRWNAMKVEERAEARKRREEERIRDKKEKQAIAKYNHEIRDSFNADFKALLDKYDLSIGSSCDGDTIVFNGVDVDTL